MMKHKPLFFFSLLITLLACQVVPIPPAIESARRATATKYSAPIAPESTSVDQNNTLTPGGSPAEGVSSGELAAIPYQRDQPFAESVSGSPFQVAQTPAWSVELPSSIAETSNPQVADGLTLRQRRQLASDGMIIVRSQEDHFIDQHLRISYDFGQPYLLTTDAAYHSLKDTYAEAVSALEAEVLQPALTEVVRSVYKQILTYFPLTVGTDYETGAHAAAAYLGVALWLLDPDTAMDQEIESLVASQAAQILSAQGKAELVLQPGIYQDFRIFDPPGHYQRSDVLKGYYLARLWLERVSFPLGVGAGQTNSFQIPLIITLALRQASTSNGPAVSEYARLLEVYEFIYGHPVKAGPVEIAPVMDQAYSRYATILSLMDDANEENFRTLMREQPFPLTGTISSYKSNDNGEQETWSFLGDREQLDLQVLKRLAQESDLSDSASLYPGGLEIMAVMGSQLAEKLQGKSGSQIDHLTMSSMRSRISDQYLKSTSVNAFDLWLMSFWGQPGFQPESIEPADPQDSQKPAWNKKALSSALGAWVDFQADTSTVQDAPAETAASPKTYSLPAPAFVEPAPEVFYLLARLADSLAAGLMQRDLVGGNLPGMQESEINRRITQLLDLADQLKRLGGIAARELAGEILTESDYSIIQTPLGPAEERYLQARRSGTDDPSKQVIPLPGLRVLDYGGDRLVHIATGKIDRVYMLVPLDGKMAIAQGGIYSYYEFSSLRDRRLNDRTWLWRLEASPPERPVWLQDLYLPEGVVMDVLAFRIGDIYRIIPVAGTISIHKAPGRDAQIMAVGKPGDLFRILDGPQFAHGLSWWKVEVFSDADIISSGWIIESQDWYERVWN